MMNIQTGVCSFSSWWLIGWGLLLGLGACQSAETGQAAKVPVARVHNSYLYQQDLAEVVDQTVTGQDSANMVQRYIDSWIKKQLLFYEAERKAKLDKAELERRVQEYRYQLLTYEYQKQYLDEKLDTLVTDEQIKTYYDQNPTNFELKQNIVKGLLIVVPGEAPNLAKVRQWLKSGNSDDLDELKSYAYTYTSNPRISDSAWIDIDALTSGTPFADRNWATLVAKGRITEEKLAGNLYLLKVLEYKIADQMSPLEFVREQITDIIINRRKIDLQAKMEDDLLEAATKKKDYEILIKQP
jgi:PPIC-type PPIASE domain